ncbi:MAG: riboflavin biosynthesis protein RibF [Bacteroidaceae bacterium]|nr:riboflavin biosynthesis protein RibF [Bacteroidaceae bacterium]
MQLITSNDRIPEPCVCTIGFFDGVHLGHQNLIQQVREEAKRSGLKSCLITFPEHPRKVLHQTFVPELLTTLEEKLTLLAATGVDYCLLLPFTLLLAELTAREFIQQIVYKRCGAQCLLIGYDHRFGHNRSEGFEEYVAYGREIGLRVLKAAPFGNYSSSLIRRALQQGDVKLVTQALGRPYSFSGKVMHGRSVGRTLGFPTANMELNDQKLLPCSGAYAVAVDKDDIPLCGGMLHIGTRPTIDSDATVTIEVHLLGFAGNLYGEDLCIHLLKYLRAPQKFPSQEALVAQLEKDKTDCLQCYSAYLEG